MVAPVHVAGKVSQVTAIDLDVRAIVRIKVGFERQEEEMPGILLVFIPIQVQVIDDVSGVGARRRLRVEVEVCGLHGGLCVADADRIAAGIVQPHDALDILADHIDVPRLNVIALNGVIKHEDDAVALAFHEDVGALVRAALHAPTGDGALEFRIDVIDHEGVGLGTHVPGEVVRRDLDLDGQGHGGGITGAFGNAHGLTHVDFELIPLAVIYFGIDIQLRLVREFQYGRRLNIALAMRDLFLDVRGVGSDCLLGDVVRVLRDAGILIGHAEEHGEVIIIDVGIVRGVDRTDCGSDQVDLGASGARGAGVGIAVADGEGIAVLDADEGVSEIGVWRGVHQAQVRHMSLKRLHHVVPLGAFLAIIALAEVVERVVTVCRCRCVFDDVQHGADRGKFSHAYGGVCDDEDVRVVPASYVRSTTIVVLVSASATSRRHRDGNDAG